MFLSQVKNIKQANRRARSDQLRSLALECKRLSHPVQIDSTSERGKREARAHLLKLLVTLCGSFGFLVLRWHLLANKGIETSSTFLTFPLSKMRRKGFQSNFVYKSLPVCLTSPDSSNFTHPSIWVSDKEGGEGDEVCSAASTSCNLSSSPNYISTDKYALANLRKFMGVSFPDYADHLQVNVAATLAPPLDFSPHSFTSPAPPHPHTTLPPTHLPPPQRTSPPPHKRGHRI